jgi:hypothetical protein
LSIFFRSIFQAAIVAIQEIIVEVVVMTHIRHIDALACFKVLLQNSKNLEFRPEPIAELLLGFHTWSGGTSRSSGYGTKGKKKEEA